MLGKVGIDEDGAVPKGSHVRLGEPFHHEVKFLRRIESAMVEPNLVPILLVRVEAMRTTGASHPACCPCGAGPLGGSVEVDQRGATQPTVGVEPDPEYPAVRDDERLDVSLLHDLHGHTVSRTS